jgi:hypothetical protein
VPDCGLATQRLWASFFCMSTVQEIESAIRKLPRAEIEALQAWIQDYLEDEKEFTKEFQASIERGKRDIAEGRTRTRQP